MDTLEQETPNSDTRPEEFQERIISRKKKQRWLNSLNLLDLVVRADRFDDYKCRNCESPRVFEFYELQNVVKIPNPSIFGDKAKPTLIEREKTIKYFCKNCNAESEDYKSLISYLDLQNDR